MKSRLLTLALAFGAALLSARSAQAQLPPPEGQPCAAEPTDQLVAYGDQVNPCQIGQLGDSDLFRFQGVAGELISIRATDRSGGGSIPGCRLELLRPVGTLVTSITNNTMCEIRITLDTSGLFIARVSEASSSSTMTYALEIDRLMPFSNTASSINPGGAINGARIDPDGDADLFLFNGANGDVVNLRGTDQSGGGSIPFVRLELFRPDGTLATSAFNNTTAIIDTTLDQTGVFTLRVTEGSNTSAMTYNVEYQCLVGSCPSFHKLKVDRTGAGTVMSSPVGIDCGTDCSERYFAGIVVTLTPVPSARWSFDNWSGGADCTDGIVTVTAETTCIATFVRVPGTPRVPTGDYDADGTTDIGVYRGTTGGWFIRRSSDGDLTHLTWGWPGGGDVPVAGDYDADGTTDIGVYRGTTGDWFIRRSSDGVLAHLAWGAPTFGDRPVPGDYDGDGTSDVAVYRESTGEWFIRRSSDAGLTHVAWGWPAGGDRPVAGDYDDDGMSDVAVYRESTGEWFIRRSSDGGLTHVAWGWPAGGDRPVAGDYDGDGMSDVAVYRESTGEWFIRRSSDAGLTHVAWGWPAGGDRPVAGDYDGDGMSDVAVYRESTGEWFIRRSSDGGLTHVAWGWPAGGDIPVPGQN